jgi:hypothetical protein
MSIVMGVDQHRAQITADWIDLDSGEISRARVTPADRAGCGGSLRGSLASSWRSRLRLRPGGGLWWRSYGPLVRGCIWLGRRRPRRCV